MRNEMFIFQRHANVLHNYCTTTVTVNIFYRFKLYYVINYYVDNAVHFYICD